MQFDNILFLVQLSTFSRSTSGYCCQLPSLHLPHNLSLSEDLFQHAFDVHEKFRLMPMKKVFDVKVCQPFKLISPYFICNSL